MLEVKTVYLKSIFDPELFQKTVSSTIAMAEKIKAEHDFDTIVFSGVSGSAMAFILGHALKVPILCVRKASDGSHFADYSKGSPLEGNIGVYRYLIVDDFISTGRTANYIIDAVSENNPQAECVAMLMYTEGYNKTHQHPPWQKPIDVISSKPME